MAAPAPRPGRVIRRLSGEEWKRIENMNPKPFIRHLKRGDAEFIGMNLRDSDMRELDAARPGRNPVDAVLRGVEDSHRVWVGALRPEQGDTPHQAYAPPHLGPDIPVAVFGLAAHPLRSDTGVPWMLAAPGFEIMPVSAARLSRRVVRAILEYHPRLENYVHAEHRTAIRWLTFCGFTIHPAPVTLPATGEPFLRFTLNPEDIH